LAALAAAVLALAACASAPKGAEAQESYNLGMAYFDLGKYADAERWLLLARKDAAVRNAAEYQLGRIAFISGDYAEASAYFEDLLKRDPENTQCLSAAAFADIKAGNLSRARNHYETLQRLTPETAENRFNYALVLYSLSDFAGAEAVLVPLAAERPDDRPVLLLLARSLRAEGKPESVDRFASYLEGGDDSTVRSEFAEALVELEFYAKAVETFDQLIQSGKAPANDVGAKAAWRFGKARALLLADPKGDAGLIELGAAVEAGYADKASLDKLVADARIGREAELRTLIEAAAAKAAAAKEAVDAPPAAQTAAPLPAPSARNPVPVTGVPTPAAE
jgi:tetratricopeptide (TPR) repeat protein